MEFDREKEKQPVEPSNLDSSNNSGHDKKIIHLLTLVLIGILCFTVIVFVFGVGLFVGQKRAEFSFFWAQDYHRNLGGPAKGLFYNFPEMDFINGHGILGPVISINANTIIVKDEDNIEKTIIISDKTAIRNNKGMLNVGDLKVGDIVVVIGSPNAKGQIEAKLIRIMPVSEAYILITPDYFSNGGNI